MNEKGESFQTLSECATVSGPKFYLTINWCNTNSQQMLFEFDKIFQNSL